MRALPRPVLRRRPAPQAARMAATGASHAISVSHPEAVAHQIMDAAALRAVA